MLKETSTSQRRRRVAAALAMVIAGLVGCASSPLVAAPIVPQPRLELLPEQLQLLPGEAAKLKARPQGGEAILFHVDWQVVEGQSGGRLETSEARDEEGRYVARYVAPASEGVFHVVARLREYPAAEARVEIRVRR